VSSLGLTGVGVMPELLQQTAALVGEETIVSRTGGAPTLAVGLAQIVSGLFGGPGMMSFWYHFAIMFEALFILTALDAGTRVARFMLQDALGNLLPRFRDTSWQPGAWLCTVVMVAGWGAMLLMGVTDPLGGINTLFPLFGIANQLLAAIALAICMSIATRKGVFTYLWIIVLPLAFATVVTVTASMHKIFSPLPSVGYWAQHAAFQEALAAGATSFGTADSVQAMEAVVRNTFVQGTLSIVFVVLAVVVVVAATVSTLRTLRSHVTVDTEDPAVPSRIYAPSGLIATKAEKSLQAQWASLQAEGVPT
jgi:carbon starvation protein